MSLKINHDVIPQQMVRRVGETSQALHISNDRLASGVSASAAVDGGAVVSLSERLRADIAGLEQASENTEIANSLIQTAEKSLQEINLQIQNMRALAIRAANEGIQNRTSLEVIQSETEAALESIDRTAKDTLFGSKHLFDGSSSLQAEAEGSGLEFVKGEARIDKTLLNQSHDVLIDQSATRNTTRGRISFSSVLDGPENILISEAGRIAQYVVNPEASEEENLRGLQQTVEKAGLNVKVELDDGALRVTHKEFGSRHVFQVESTTPGLLSGDIETRGVVQEKFQDEGEMLLGRAIDVLNDLVLASAENVGSLTHLPNDVFAAVDSYVGLKENLQSAFQGNNKARVLETLQENLEILDQFGFLAPSRLVSQPQEIIRLNETQLILFGISEANKALGIDSTNFGNLVSAAVEELQNQSGEVNLFFPNPLDLLSIGQKVAERLAPEIEKGLRFLLGKEPSSQLGLALDKRLPRFVATALEKQRQEQEAENSRASTASAPKTTTRTVTETQTVTGPDGQPTTQTTTRTVTETTSTPVTPAQIPIDLGEVIAVLDPSRPDSGFIPQQPTDGRTSFFINNGRDAIGSIGGEQLIGDGTRLRGTNRFQGVLIGFNDKLDEGETGQGSLKFERPGLEFQVGHQAEQLEFFGFPQIDTTQLAQGIANASSYRSLADIDLSSSDGATDALLLLDAANNEISQLRGLMGSFAKNLESNVAALQSLVLDVTQGESQVADTDYAHETMEQLRHQIKLNQQGAIMSQGNLSARNVLRLIEES